MTREEWEALRYRIEIQELSEEEGGGWMAWIPQLGQGLFMVDAETADEAVSQLETLRRSLYDTVMESGRPIPIPADVTDTTATSGRWLMRASKRLHAELKSAAEREGVSFNSYCESALERGHLVRSCTEAMERLAKETLERTARAIERRAEEPTSKWGGSIDETSRSSAGESSYDPQVLTLEVFAYGA